MDRAPARDYPPDRLARLLAEARREGISFFGLLGGEPLLYPALWDVLEARRDCYFLLFTNGAALDDATAERLARLGNVTVLVSVEGVGDAADLRRGGRDVTGRAFDAMAACRKAGLFFGVATSVCRSNHGALVNEGFLDELVRRGAHYVWYYIYRPAGPRPMPELCLTRDEILGLRRFIVAMRAKKPIVVVDAYWDEEGRALCPAAEGVAYHISPDGAVEPCPILQFAAENVDEALDAASAAPGGPDAPPPLTALFENSALLKDFSARAPTWTRGCPLMASPDALAGFLRGHGARVTTIRDGYGELDRLSPCASHDLGDDAVPDTHWLYRYMKKHWFFGFGAYG